MLLYDVRMCGIACQHFLILNLEGHTCRSYQRQVDPHVSNICEIQLFNYWMFILNNIAERDLL